MSSRTGPNQLQVSRARVDVESPGLGPMSSQLGSGQCWVSQARPMSSRTSPSQCLEERAWVYVESIGPWPMSSREGPSWCQVERAQADVESFELGPKSSRLGSDRCRVVRAWTNVEGVRIYDFKLEGGELFKEGFYKLLSLEWKYFKKTLIKKSVFQNIKQKAQY